jgi:GTPase SAR1 family protein
MVFLGVIRELTEESFMFETNKNSFRCKIDPSLRSECQKIYGTDLQLNMAALLTFGSYNIGDDMVVMYGVASIVRSTVPVLLVKTATRTGIHNEVKGLTALGEDVQYIWERCDEMSNAELVYCVPDKKPVIRTVTKEDLEDVLEELLGEDGDAEEEEKMQVCNSSQIATGVQASACAKLGVIREVTSRYFALETNLSTHYFQVSQGLYDTFRRLYGVEFQVNMAVVVTPGEYVSGDEDVISTEVNSIDCPDVPVLLIRAPEGNIWHDIVEKITRDTDVHTIWDGVDTENHAEIVYHAPGKMPVVQIATEEQFEGVLMELLKEELEEDIEEVKEAVNDLDLPISVRTDVVQVSSRTTMGIIREVTNRSFVLETRLSTLRFKITQSLCEDFRRLYGVDLKVNMAVVVTYGDEELGMIEVKSIARPDIPMLLISGTNEICLVAEILAEENGVHIISEQCCGASHAELVYHAPDKTPIVRSVTTKEQLKSVLVELLKGCGEEEEKEVDKDLDQSSNLMGVIRKWTSEGFTLETKAATLDCRLGPGLRSDNPLALFEECWKVYNTGLQVNMAVLITGKRDIYSISIGKPVFEIESITRPAVPVLLIKTASEKGIWYSAVVKLTAEGKDVHTIWERSDDMSNIELVYHAPGKMPVIRTTTEKQIEDVLEKLLGEEQRDEQKEAHQERGFTILLIGEVSSGKSSLLNSLAGGYVANAGQQRETMCPSSYRLGVNQRDDVVQRISKALESTHLRNEAARISELDEEDLCKLEIVADENDPIPFDLSTGNINVIDFAGINDADDKDGRLFLPIKKHINSADLVVFVTAADRAFQNSSEVESFKRLQTLIAAEVACGHFVDLVVVVNKFDDPYNPDLLKMAERIPERIDLPKEKILRVSSHKMLLSNVKLHNRKLYIPTFARREVAEILKTASVQITQALKEELVESGTISHTNIEYQLALDDLLSSDEPKVAPASSSNRLGVCSSGVHATRTHAHLAVSASTHNQLGDWDGLIRYLGHFGTHLPEMTSLLMRGRLDKWVENCIKFCDTYPNHGMGSIMINGYIKPLYAELEVICNNKVHVKSEVITEVMVELVDKLWSKAVQYHAGCSILEVVLQWLLGAGDAQRGVVHKILDLLGDADKTIASPHTRIFALCESLGAGVECPDGLVKAVLSSAELYGSNDGEKVKELGDKNRNTSRKRAAVPMEKSISLPKEQCDLIWFNCSSGAAQSGYPRCKPQPSRDDEECNPRWAVQTLLNHLPDKWAKLLKLATMPATYVQTIVSRAGLFTIPGALEIPSVLGKSSDFSVMLEYRLSSTKLSGAEKSGAPLGASLFRLEEETDGFMRQYRIFNKSYLKR